MLDALSRRIVCLKINVDTVEALFEPNPSSNPNTIDFRCACLYIRMLYPLLPILPNNLLLILYILKYRITLELIDIDIDRLVSIIIGRVVVIVISSLILYRLYRIIEKYSLISISYL
jgi:hypothetical protein